MAMTTPKTFGDLKRLVDSNRRGSWPSRVNPGMTHAQALGVLSDGLAAYPDDMHIDEAVRGEIYKRNVLRECSQRDGD